MADDAVVCAAGTVERGAPATAPPGVCEAGAAWEAVPSGACGDARSSKLSPVGTGVDRCRRSMGVCGWRCSPFAKAARSTMPAWSGASDGLMPAMRASTVSAVESIVLVAGENREGPLATPVAGSLTAVAFSTMTLLRTWSESLSSSDAGCASFSRVAVPPSEPEVRGLSGSGSSEGPWWGLRLVALVDLVGLTMARGEEKEKLSRGGEGRRASAGLIQL